VGNIVAVHEPLDGPNTRAIWVVHIYTNKNVNMKKRTTDE